MGKLHIKKSSGRHEPFSEQKLKMSLMRSGADADLAREVIKELLPKLYPGISTRKIHRMAFSILKRKSRKSAALYRLDRAILEMGPDGFLFEKFICELMKAQGYKTRNGVILQGRCIDHEVDVIAQKDDHTIYIECKFHNALIIKNDVKVALYVHSRWQDLKANSKNKFDEFWVISNTDFTQDSIDFANCSGLKVFGQNHPAEHAVSHMVQNTGIHPVTSLTCLNKIQKKKLLKEGILLVRQIQKKPAILKSLNLSEKKLNQLCAEIDQLINHRSYK